jgi:hypothetical protein
VKVAVGPSGEPSLEFIGSPPHERDMGVAVDQSRDDGPIDVEGLERLVRRGETGAVSRERDESVLPSERRVVE